MTVTDNEWHSRVDTFFSGNNGATRLFGDSNDSSIQAESNGTHHDCSFKNIGSGLGHYSTCAKGRQYAKISANAVVSVFCSKVRISSFTVWNLFEYHRNTNEWCIAIVFISSTCLFAPEVMQIAPFCRFYQFFEWFFSAFLVDHCCLLKSRSVFVH